MEPRQLADWLVARLTGPAAQAEWTRVVVGSTERVLTMPLGTLLPEEEFETLVAAWMTPERLGGFGALCTFALPEVLAEARPWDEAFDSWLTEETQDAIVQLVRRPGWVPEGWVREIFAQQVTEDLIYDILHRGLRDFSSLVPRLLERILPGGLGRLARLGTKASTRAFDEVENLLEGEIKKWLERGTRRSVDAAAQRVIERFDAPAGQAGRENLVRFGLRRSAAEHVAPLDADVTGAIQRIARLVARDLGNHPRGVEAARSLVHRLYARYAPGPLSELLRDAGLLRPSLPSEAWARATWPVMCELVKGPEGRGFVEGLAADVLTRIAAEDA